MENKIICHVAGDFLGEDIDYDEDVVITEETRANAEFIVRAVNSHDKLVGALECLQTALIWADSKGFISHVGTEAFKLAQEALKLAKGETSARQSD